MSFAEIKKAVNSDLNVPLNELIEKNLEYEYGTYNYAKSPNLQAITKETTLVEVSSNNGGYLNALEISMPQYYLSTVDSGSGAKIYVKVYIDGVKEWTLVYNITNYSASCILPSLIFARKKACDMSATNNGNVSMLLYIPCLFKNGVLVDLNNNNINDKGVTITSSSATDRKPAYFRYLQEKGLLKFNDSVKITYEVPSAVNVTTLAVETRLSCVLNE